jgi:L-lactate permease
MLFESLGYRGFWERVFSGLSLFGTPLAIVASLLIV